METKKMRPIIDLLKDSWTLFTKVWVRYLLIYLVSFFGFGALAVAFVGSTVGLTLMNATNQEVLSQTFIKYWPIFLIALVIFGIFSAFISLAANKLIFSEGEGKSVSFREVFGYSFSHFMFYFFITIATGLVVLLGLVLLIIPGIYAGIVLSLVPVVFVLEDKHDLKVFSRSRELVRGYFWPVFGRLVVLGLIGGVLSSITNQKNLGWLQLIVNFIFGVISIAYVYYIYKDLVELKKTPAVK